MEGFTRLSKEVWVFEKVETSTGDHPDYVIIFGWMGAQLSHIRKYVDQYKIIYPNITPIIVVSRAEHFYEGKQKREQSIAPLADYLNKQGIFDGGSNVLIHVFSNGGAYQLAQLSTILHNGQYKGPRRLAFIFDSCPGTTTLTNSIDALTISIKPPLLRYLSILILSILLSIIYITVLLTRSEFPIEKTRKTLQSLTVFPGTKPSTPRLYIFSEKDRLVASSAVESHFTEAKGLGYNVRFVKFGDCQHVQNARVHPEEYWKAVQEIWAEAKNA
ncbi:hypothetical protein QCA50_001566 [Cerrena zonata]|uniref:Uncharacterized protein n=1 Tax=Cerrena zonata TaxID=2478898 RepID=A0AAW0GMD3_9APHY